MLILKVMSSNFSMTDPSSGKMNTRQPDVQDIYLHMAFHYIQNCRTFTFPTDKVLSPVVSYMTSVMLFSVWVVYDSDISAAELGFGPG